MKSNSKKIRYGIVGLGHIAQVAVLPAFQNAKQNSELTALISSDSEKLAKLAKKYHVEKTFATNEIAECLSSHEIDALYIATPNSDHKRFIEMAAEAEVHILCEKPLAPSAADCAAIADIIKKRGVKLMTAYRLHFEPANLEAIHFVNSKLEEPLLFNSVFSMQVNDRKNIRLREDKGGGPLLDIGIYCVNAARYLFRDEPIEVIAQSVNKTDDPRFQEVNEAVSVSMKFAGAKIANFVVSFGNADQSYYEVVGANGILRLDQAYEYAEGATMTMTAGKTRKTKKYPKHDQFAPELIYFSDCILQDREPEPSADEGLADLIIIDAIKESLRSHRAVEIGKTLERVGEKDRPSLEQKILRPAIKPPKEFHCVGPSVAT